MVIEVVFGVVSGTVFEIPIPRVVATVLDERDEASAAVEDPVREIASLRDLPGLEGGIRSAR